MIPDWVFRIRGRVPHGIGLILGLLPILALVLIWGLVTRGAPEERVFGPTILPSPSEVVESFSDLVTTEDTEGRTLFAHIWISLRRVGLGFLLALAIVVPLGILMGSFGSARAFFDPVVTASGYIPIATLVPLTMSWFGLDEIQKVVFLSMAFGIFLVPLVIKAVDSVPDVFLRTAYTLGASRWQVILRVLVPVALPDIWHSMRLAFGVGWTYLVLAEVVVKTGGLGDLIDTARRRALSGRVYLVICIITLIAWIADLIWKHLADVFFPYRRSRT
ncbi:MAG: cmpB [Acidobacteria bacterium]|jgi:NitT/TauT family transport system permease protein|nr:cmpB [Acidobacteriota bacterium]